MELRRPNTPILKSFALLAASAAAVWTWYALAAGGADPAAVEQRLNGIEPSFAALKALELGWVEKSFHQVLVYSPLGPLPCAAGLSSSHGDRELLGAVRQALARAEAKDFQAAIVGLIPHARGGRSKWLATLVLGNLLLQDGKADAAVETLDRLLAQPSTRDYFGRLKSAAASRSDSRVLQGFLALYYASGQVRLRQGIEDAELWYALRNAIGACTALVQGTGEGVVSREPCTIMQPLPAPGCATATITSYDLYSNLLVGYLQVKSYHGGTKGREGELERKYDPAPEVNPLASVLEQAREQWTDEDYHAREHWLWAISNAESLLRSTGQKPPPNARLSFHLAQLLESARRDCPAAALPALRRQRDELIRAAREALPAVVPEADKALLASGLTRLEWIAAIRDGSVIEPGGHTAWLGEAQGRVAVRVAASAMERSEPARLARRVLGEAEELRATFGEQAAAWLAAARQDLAAVLADAGDTGLAFGVLRIGDEVPTALAARGGPGKWLHTLRGSSVGPVAVGLIAVLVFMAVMLVGLWLALQMRRRKELFTSFYRREALVRMEGR